MLHMYLLFLRGHVDSNAFLEQQPCYRLATAGSQTQYREGSYVWEGNHARLTVLLARKSDRAN
jgi:hypothetical protein